jgi:hypothetical protein
MKSTNCKSHSSFSRQSPRKLLSTYSCTKSLAAKIDKYRISKNKKTLPLNQDAKAAYHYKSYQNLSKIKLKRNSMI